MATLFELAFDQTFGDLAVENGDLVHVTDNEAVRQDAQLAMVLQIGFAQYAPDEGWNWMRYHKASLDSEEIASLLAEVQDLLERIDFVVEAVVTYVGFQLSVSGLGEHIFDVQLRTTFGTISVPAALGGFDA